jgi:hypothetical protein
MKSQSPKLNSQSPKLNAHTPTLTAVKVSTSINSLSDLPVIRRHNGSNVGLSDHAALICLVLLLHLRYRKNKRERQYMCRRKGVE